MPRQYRRQAEESTTSTALAQPTAGAATGGLGDMLKNLMQQSKKQTSGQEGEASTSTSSGSEQPDISQVIKSILAKQKEKQVTFGGASEQAPSQAPAQAPSGGANPLAAILEKLKAGATGSAPAAGSGAAKAEAPAEGASPAGQKAEMPTPANDACGRVNKLVQSAVAKSKFPFLS